MQNRSVALVIDNPKRDLRGTVLTAYQLARKGCLSSIVPMYSQGYDLPLLAPDIVLLNYIRQNNEDLARSYKKLGIVVAVMDTEGGILSNKGLREPHTWAASLRTAGLAGLVDHYFFWGDAVRQAFLANSGLRASQLHLTGCPRYDLCRPPWSAALSYSSSDFVLVNTNFSAINPAFTRSGDAEKKIFRVLGWSDAYIDLWFKQLEAVFPRYLDEVEALAVALPNQKIVVRPHPFESQKIYQERFARVANVVVDGTGDVLNMIHAANCVVHLNCGTSVDALLQRKVPVSLEYLNTDLLLDHTPLPSRLSLKPRSRIELIQTVEGLVKGNISFDHEAAFREIEPWFYRADGAAAERVAAVLTGLQPSGARRSLYLAMRGGRPSPSIAQIFQGVAAVALGTKTVSRVRGKVEKNRQGKEILPEDIQSLLDFYAAAQKGPRFKARFARNKFTGASLSTLEIVPV